MRNILVPTEPHGLMRSVLEVTLLVAARFESYIEGFALRPAIPEYVPIDMVSGLTWQADEKADEEAVEQARAMFHAFMQERGMPRSSTETQPGFGWFDKAPAGDTFVSGYGRIFDLIVVGRPTSGQAMPSMATLEAALFETGRPILIAPPQAPRTMGDTVVIAWNGSTETARAVAFSMPFLRKASRVIVLTVEGGMVPGPSGEQLAQSLRRNGLTVEAIKAAGDARNAGATFLSKAASLDADLVIKGAYTQSRLRQMIFGGATSHILSAATVPVLMAH